MSYTNKTQPSFSGRILIFDSNSKKVNPIFSAICENDKKQIDQIVEIDLNENDISYTKEIQNTKFNKSNNFYLGLY